MSSILDALKKVEEERAAKSRRSDEQPFHAASAGVDLLDDEPRPGREVSHFKLSIPAMGLILAVFAALMIAVAVLMPGRSGEQAPVAIAAQPPAIAVPVPAQPASDPAPAPSNPTPSFTAPAAQAQLPAVASAPPAATAPEPLPQVHAPSPEPVTPAPQPEVAALAPAAPAQPPAQAEAIIPAAPPVQMAAVEPAPEEPTTVAPSPASLPEAATIADPAPPQDAGAMKREVLPLPAPSEPAGQPLVVAGMETETARPAARKKDEAVAEDTALPESVLPEDIRQLPRLPRGEYAKYGLEELTFNMIREENNDRGEAHAVINLVKVYIGERIPDSRVKLVAVRRHGVAIEVEQTGSRYYISRR
ncbi:MAG: hypothetical protein HYV27_15000 [Candidatus Hydrogenedentes bacterium]|nr:hypothetical protein [Candidatus Hydrogenedentota bacterium]